MALLGPSTDYTDKDFDALRARVRNLIRSTFPEWTDEDSANFGNILVELFCFVGDVLTKYQDNQAAEAFIGRVTQRKNMLALCKLIGFVPRGNTASQVELSLSLPAALAGKVDIPARSRFKTEQVVDPVIFETLVATQIPASSLGPIVVTAENAEYKEETFTATSLPNQEFQLANTPFLDDSLTVIAGDGTYTVVDNFLESTSTDKHVTVTVDQDDRATVRFGDGRNGSIPTGTIVMTYKIGGGTEGRVEAGTVVRVEGSYTDEFGSPAPLQVTNLAASSTALDRQTIEEIRVAAPESLRVLTRTVAREDYEINARRVAGVARALMLTNDQDVSIAENSGLLFIVPTDGGVPSQALKDAVLEMVTVTFPNTLTFMVTVHNPTYLTVNVSTIVWLAQGANPATVRDAIEAALEDAFAIESEDGTPTEGIDFGYNLRDENGDPAGTIAWSDIFNVIRDVSGVRKVDAGSDGLLLNGVRDDLSIALREFPILGTMDIINGDTGLPL